MGTTGTPIEYDSYRERPSYFEVFFRFFVSLAIVLVGLSILAVGILRFYRPYLYKYPFFQDVYGTKPSLAYRGRSAQKRHSGCSVETERLSKDEQGEIKENRGFIYKKKIFLASSSFVWGMVISCMNLITRIRKILLLSVI